MTSQPNGSSASSTTAGSGRKPRVYIDTIRLDDDLRLGAVEVALEKVREYGTGEILLSPFRLRMSFEADDDWDLREVLADVEQELAAWGIEFEVDKEKMTR